MEITALRVAWSQPEEGWRRALELADQGKAKEANMKTQ